MTTANRLFQILTFGCKVNQCDSAGLARELTGLGWRAAPEGAAPGLVLVNTCTVTARADQQARQAIRRLAREHPGVPLWVTGCYAQRAPREVAALPGVSVVLGNREKARLGAICCQALPPADRGVTDSPSPSRGEGQGGGEALGPLTGAASGGRTPGCVPAEIIRPQIFVGAYSSEEPFHPWRLDSFPGHTRAWLKVQEGCRHQCRYCIVPTVRGPRRSMAPGAVQAALLELAGAGYREVVLTGVDLGQYGQDLTPSGTLAGLVARLKTAAWPFRMRLSSLEPQEVTHELLTALASWENFCPHFHLPLQSGADEILTAMGRPYRAGEFRDLCREINRRFPQAALGLDVLVGFPGETAAAFEATYDLVAQLPATYLHVFPFSPRPGTPAALLEPVPVPEVQRRAGVMRELGKQKRRQFLEAQVGEVREVLVEGPAPRPGWLKGLSANYLRVLLPGPPDCRNQLLPVRFLKVQGETVIGELAPYG